MANGPRSPMTRLRMWLHPTVVLTSALRRSSAPTRALYSASSCHRRAEVRLLYIEVPPLPLCQLPPAADMFLHWVSSESCQKRLLAGAADGGRGRDAHY